MTTNPAPLAGFVLDELPSPSKPAHITKPDDETVTLRGVRIPLASDVGCAFISDCARNRERIFSDDRLREKYEINSDADWTKIINNKSLRLAINSESERRMLNGTAAQESAAKIFTEEGPQTLGSILRDQRASPRHRISAAQELRHTARSGDEKTGDTADRVVISINLGADEKLVFDCGPPKQKKEPSDGETEKW